MPDPAVQPRRGEIWYADLDPIREHEQGGRRPVLVLSVDSYNRSRFRIVITLPVTSRLRGWAARVPIQPPEGGLALPSEIICDQLRAIALDRLDRRLGAVEPNTMLAVERTVRILLGL